MSISIPSTCSITPEEALSLFESRGEFPCVICFKRGCTGIVIDTSDEVLPKIKEEKHHCEGYTASCNHGAAISCCYERNDGTFWVDNDEYGSQVNYCPYCGAKAPVQGHIERED